MAFDDNDDMLALLFSGGPTGHGGVIGGVWDEILAEAEERGHGYRTAGAGLGALGGAGLGSFDGLLGAFAGGAVGALLGALIGSVFDD